MLPLLLLATLATALPIRDGRFSDFDHGHAGLAAVLEAHVVGGRVRYAELASNQAALEAYLASLQTVSPESMLVWTNEQQMAFGINAYNAYALLLVVESYPIQSIQDLGTLVTRVWEKEFIPLEAFHPKGRGAKLSLNHIEHDILRKRFRDARLHAAIHCASESCPVLRPEPYVAERLGAQLDEQSRIWLADATRNRFDPQTGSMQISEIFRWYEADFARDGGSVQGWIAKYAPPETAAWLKDAKDVKVGYIDHSWKLDDAAAAR